ncbi:pyridoxal phosphate-dependent aminotransferase [Pontibacillus yanchengensis Y32]|uniref:Pyridoxal phosphate-dependent aminotransferase n=2 Tax=Pontibacillus yanchengensis TaxID=462910 RepID=A0A0A2TJE7_9BACI|nr:pyridoxal phosphate-dependent aminotransferase [Pontibacillus yanchengensis Y32]
MEKNSSNSKQKLYLSSPHMGGNEQLYVQEAFDSNWIAPLGPNVNKFEEELANYAGVNAASALSSGTAAIHLALRLLGVQEGDKVFCSTLTFVASANPIMYQAAEPIFIDSEPETWNISPVALKNAFDDSYKKGELPKAVIVVNLYGQSAKLDEILDICEQYEVPVIEDAAESLGSSYKGQKSGSFGHFGIYSFNGNKIITTSGGGMLVSNDEEAIKQSRFLAAQARDNALHYQHSTYGYNYRMSNILAGVGRGQLEVLDLRVEQKRSIFNRYVEGLNHIEGIEFMPELEGTFSNRWLTACLIDREKLQVNPSDIIGALAEENIEARPVWKPLHMQPAYEQSMFFPHDSQIVSEDLFARGICLPSGTNMSVEDQNRVIEIIKKVLN